MPTKKNAFTRILDDIDSLGRYFTILLVLFPAIAGALAAHKISSILGLIILTTPFTLAIALQSYLINAG